MVQFQGKHRLPPEALRVNLDSTLQLVDLEDPEKSELLTGALMPHKSTQRAVMSGPNDVDYQILSRWVQLIKSGAQPVEAKLPRNFEPTGPSRTSPKPSSSPKGLTGTTGDAFPPSASAPSGFASDRVTRQVDANPLPAPGPSASLPAARPEATTPGARPTTDQSRAVAKDSPSETPLPPAGRLVPGSYTGAAPTPPEGTKFPTPAEENERIAEAYLNQQIAKAKAAQRGLPEPEFPPLPQPGAPKPTPTPSPGTAKTPKDLNAPALGKADPQSKAQAKTEASKTKRKPKNFDLDSYQELMIRRNSGVGPQ